MREQSDNPIPPLNQVLQTFKKIEEEKGEEEVLKDDQELIASLAGDSRWKAMQKVIMARIEALKEMIDPFSGQPLFDSTDTPETIGIKYLTVSMIVRYLKEIHDYPETIFKNE